MGALIFRASHHLGNTYQLSAIVYSILLVYHLNSERRTSILGWYQISQFIFNSKRTSAGKLSHYNDVIMSVMASQITSFTTVYSTVYPRRRSKKTSMFRITGLCVGNSPATGEFPHKWPVTRKMFPFDDFIMKYFISTGFNLTYSPNTHRNELTIENVD